MSNSIKLSNFGFSSIKITKSDSPSIAVAPSEKINVVAPPLDNESSSIKVGNAQGACVDVGNFLPVSIIPPATDTRLGGVKIPQEGALTVSSEGALSIKENWFVKEDVREYAQITPSLLATNEQRAKSFLYVNHNDTPMALSVEQVKNLGTKILAIESFDDTAIQYLSNNDYLLFKTK